jgi:hypothetical protein
LETTVLADSATGSSDALLRLRTLLSDEGGLIATLVDSSRSADSSGTVAAAAPCREESPARVAAQGPRTAPQREEYELLVEAIYEGYLLHYGVPRVLHAPDADLRVLAGDRLYAIGLARLVELGDTLAVAELADTISLSALAQGAGERELADAVWAAGARAVGWGSSEQHGRAKELVASGEPEAFEAMRTSAQSSPASP